jgi:hypothetical protein
MHFDHALSNVNAKREVAYPIVITRPRKIFLLLQVTCPAEVEASNEIGNVVESISTLRIV